MTNDKQQTAVEWLFDKMFDPTYPAGEQINWLEQAKDRENIAKQEAYNQGFAKAKSIYLDAE
jgi:hypothetical protein